MGNVVAETPTEATALNAALVMNAETVIQGSSSVSKDESIQEQEQEQEQEQGQSNQASNEEPQVEPAVPVNSEVPASVTEPKTTGDVVEQGSSQETDPPPAPPATVATVTTTTTTEPIQSPDPTNIAPPAETTEPSNETATATATTEAGIDADAIASAVNETAEEIAAQAAAVAAAVAASSLNAPLKVVAQHNEASTVETSMVTVGEDAAVPLPSNVSNPIKAVDPSTTATTMTTQVSTDFSAMVVDGSVPPTSQTESSTTVQSSSIVTPAILEEPTAGVVTESEPSSTTATAAAVAAADPSTHTESEPTSEVPSVATTATTTTTQPPPSSGAGGKAQTTQKRVTKKRVRRVGNAPQRKLAKTDSSTFPPMVAVPEPTTPTATTIEPVEHMQEMAQESATNNHSDSTPRVLSKHDEKWNSMFDKLVKFKAKHNSTLVPQCYDQDPRLGRWVHYQRVEYWIFQQSGNGKITPDRIARLENIGFEWDPQRAQWNTMFEKLKLFKNEVGHCKVPKGYSKDPELANWVRNQRLEHANMAKGKRSRMTQDRFEKLDVLGFKWSSTTPSKGAANKTETTATSITTTTPTTTATTVIETEATPPPTIPTPTIPTPGTTKGVNMEQQPSALPSSNMTPETSELVVKVTESTSQPTTANGSAHETAECSVQATTPAQVPDPTTTDASNGVDMPLVGGEPKTEPPTSSYFMEV